MPRASELEEFGLEVESENHALVAESSSRRKLGPTSAQLAVLHSANTPPTRMRPGMLRWASLVIVLAVIVFFNIGQEREEAGLMVDEGGYGESEDKIMEIVVDEGTNPVSGEWEGGGKVEDGGVGEVGDEQVELVEDDESISEEKSNPDVEFKIDDEKEESHLNEQESQKDQDDSVVDATDKDGNEQNPDHDDSPDSNADEVQQQKAEKVEEEEEEEGEKVDEETVENEEVSTNVELHNKETTTNNPGILTPERIQATREAAQSLITLIENYYYGVETTAKMMLESWVGPWDFEALSNNDATPEARARLEKLVDTMARALVSDDQKEFIIGTIGSSVAAGHDNCQYDSYENQLQRTFGVVWEAAGMKLVCQNAGETGACGDNFQNQAFCIKQNVSPKIDIAHYTWSYFEVGNSEEALKTRESLIRWTQMLPRQPPVHVLNVEGSGQAGDEETELTVYYSKYGYDAFYMRYAYRQGGYDYDTEAKNGIDRFGWGYVGDGYHNTTRYGENEENPDRKESLGVVMRNWHPGPLAFQMISDTFSLVYSKAMLLALKMIESDIAAGIDPREKWSSKRKVLSKKSLPPPLRCDPEYCVVDEAPGCLNFELPTYGFWGAKVEDPEDDLNPHKGELQNWEIWKQPRDIWDLVNKEDVVIFQDREDKEICRHLDACAGMSATSPDNGMIVFRLPKMEVGLVVVCGLNIGNDVAGPMFINNTDIEVRYNGALLDRSSWDVFPNAKCVRLLQRFPTEGAASQTPTGHAYLSIKALDSMVEPVRISHVITL